MKAIVHFTQTNGMKDEFHFEGTPEAIREAAIRELTARGCDLSLAWTEEVHESRFAQV